MEAWDVTAAQEGIKRDAADRPRSSIAGVFTACAATSAKPSEFADNRARNDAKVAEELKGLTPSPPHDCIDSRRLRNATAEPYGNTILYRVGSNLVYRYDTSGGCSGLDHGESLIDKFNPGNTSNSGQMCRGDILYSRDQRLLSGGSCMRGAWIAYTK